MNIVVQINVVWNLKESLKDIVSYIETLGKNSPGKNIYGLESITKVPEDGINLVSATALTRLKQSHWGASAYSIIIVIQFNSRAIF